jgi:hypothetical protein
MRGYEIGVVVIILIVAFRSTNRYFRVNKNNDTVQTTQRDSGTNA